MRRLVVIVAPFFLASPSAATERKAQPAPTPPPLVRMNAAPPTWTYGAWTVSNMGDFTIAGTTNESGSAFGAVCGKDCVWFVNFRTECKVGDSYPAMINSPAGAYAIQLRCYYLDHRWLLTHAMSDSSVDTIAKGGEICFAFPFESGKFGVSRFSLRGGAEAVIKALDVIVKRREQSQEGLRDFTI
jgi:hypothetical protein